MEMLDSRKDFRGEVLRIMSQFGQCGIDPPKHARSRPMRLNIRRPFSHGVLSRRLNDGSIGAIERQSAVLVCSLGNPKNAKTKSCARRRGFAPPGDLPVPIPDTPRLTTVLSFHRANFRIRLLRNWDAQGRPCRSAPSCLSGTELWVLHSWF